MTRRLNLGHLRRLPRRPTSQPNMIARMFLNPMPLHNLLGINAQIPRQNIHNQHPNAMRRARILRKQVLLLHNRLRPLPPHLIVRDDHVVLADVEELRVILRPFSIHVRSAEHLVPEQLLLVRRELHLLVCRHCHEALADEREFFGAIEDRLAFVWTGEFEVEESAAFTRFEHARFFFIIVREEFSE